MNGQLDSLVIGKPCSKYTLICDYMSLKLEQIKDNSPSNKRNERCLSKIRASLVLVYALKGLYVFGYLPRGSQGKPNKGIVCVSRQLTKGSYANVDGWCRGGWNILKILHKNDSSQVRTTTIVCAFANVWGD